MATRPPTVDLNADLGEGVSDDPALLAVVTSANVACGYHAGSAPVMRQVCELAVERGVAVGAHVSYADREHVGRVDRDVSPAVLREQVADQVGTLGEVARAAGTEVRYLKPHGALYHRVRHDADQARAVLDGSGRLPLLGLPGVCLDLASAVGRIVALEGFADRRIGPDGHLVPRSEPDALLLDTDEVVAQALALAAGVASVCLHGDSPGALAHAVAVRAGLVGAGWRLASFLDAP